MSDVQDSALAALKKFCDDNGVPEPPPKPRNYVACSWCSGRGCISCAAARKEREGMLDAEYRRQFPNGPQPIFTAKVDKPEEMAQFKEIFHVDAITKAFSPGGDGIEGIEKRCQEAMAKRESSDAS